MRAMPVMEPVVSHVAMGNGQYHMLKSIEGTGASGMILVSRNVTSGSTMP